MADAEQEVVAVVVDVAEKRAPDATVEAEEQPDAKRPKVEADTEVAVEVEEVKDAAAPVAPAVAPAPAAPREPVVIGYKTFATGSECYKYFHTIMTNYRKNQNLNDYEFHNLMELVRVGHPEAERKLASKVAAVQIRDVYMAGKPSSCFHLLREDGAIEDVSYRKCVANLFQDMQELMVGSTSQKPRNSQGQGGGGGGRGRGGGRGGGRRGGGRGGRGGGNKRS